MANDLPNPIEEGVREQVLAAERRRREEAHAARRLVRTHFNNLTHFRYEQPIGSGVYGVAHSVIEKRFSKRGRRLIVKRSQSVRKEAELRHEINMMTLLNGSAHIAAVIAAKENDVQPEPQRRPGFFKRLVSKLAGREKKHMLTGLPGPALVLEHLENGTAHDLIYSLYDRRRMLPNRVLWRFFLCLVRACVAMRAPPRQPFGTKSKLEEIPVALPRMGIAHCDMHSGNVLLGSVGDFPEHNVVPPMKLIDFGLSIRMAGEHCDLRNILDVGKQIYYLIIRGYDDDIGQRVEPYEGIMTMATEIVPGVRDVYHMLDDDLRLLVVRCLAGDPAERPSLNEALEICRNAVETRHPGYYGYRPVRETDLGINVLFQELLYDAY